MVVSCPQCGMDATEVTGNTLACNSCGTVVEESEIVSEVAFAENSFGGAVVQGNYVADDAVGARNSLSGTRGMSTSNSTATTVHNAQRGIRQLASARNVPHTVAERAARLFRLALQGGTTREDGPKLPNFVLGRRTEYTQAACLYLACRIAKTNHLLIDFADALQVNVFILGRAYQRLVDCLNFRDKDGVKDAVDPSRLVMRFAAMLDFGDQTNDVATDATRLVARFKHDWLVEGRRPAGICGACLLLAARMNGFRRSIIEVVQVVKIADSTIRERLKEFKKTPMAHLPIHDFRTRWDESFSLPPSFKPQKSKRTMRTIKSIEGSKLTKRRKTMDAEGPGGQAARDGDPDAQHVEGEVIEGAGNTDNEDGDVEEGAGGADDEDAESDMSDVPPELDNLITEATTADVRKYMEQIEYMALDKQLQEKERRRAEKAKAGLVGGEESDSEAARALSASPAPQTGEAGPSMIKISASQQDSGAPVTKESASPAENGMDSAIKTSASQAHDGTNGKTDATSLKMSFSQDNPPADRRGRRHREIEEPGEAAFAVKYPPSHYIQPSDKPAGPVEPIDELRDLDEEELDAFILTPEEAQAKERVWIEFNKDFLQKSLDKQLKLEQDLKNGIQPKDRSRRRPTKPRDSTTASSSAYESTKQMMQKKQFSRKLNYDNLSSLFETGTPSANGLNMHSSSEPWGSSARRGRGGGRRPRQEGAQEGASGPARNYYNSDAETSASEFEYETIDLETNEAPSTARGNRKESREMRRHKAQRKATSAASGASSNASGAEDGNVTPRRAGSGTDQATSANEEDLDDEEDAGEGDLDEDARRVRAMASSFQEQYDDVDDDGEAY